MTKFELTNHARDRIKERGIKDPNGVVLKPIKKKHWTKKRIKELCVLEGFKNDYIYWKTKDNINTVYVCRQKDIGLYVVITAFNLGGKNI